MDNNKYFYLGGFISLSIFFISFFLFIYVLFSNIKIKEYGLTKKNYISISLNTPILKNNGVIKDKSVKKISKKTFIKDTNLNRDIDVNDLFSDVWTKNITHKEIEKKINSKRISQLQKRIKTTKKNDIETIADKVESVNQNNRKTKQSQSSANEVNEYLAKIQALVYKHFYPPPNTEGFQVKTLIELDPFGKVLDFRILNYSSNILLNEEVDNIKNRLKNIIFPKNPKNKYTKTIIILISKE